MTEITNQSKLSKCDNHIEAEVDGEIVLMHMDNGKFFSLTGTGLRTWELMEEGQTVSALIDSLLKEFDVPRSQCESDVLELLDGLKQRALIKVS